MSAEKAVIIATGEGPFLGLHAGASGETRPLGLEGKGPVRAVIHDHKEQGRLYAATLAEGVWRSDNGGGSEIWPNTTGLCFGNPRYNRAPGI